MSQNNNIFFHNQTTVLKSSEHLFWARHSANYGTHNLVCKYRAFFFLIGFIELMLWSSQEPYKVNRIGIILIIKPILQMREVRLILATTQPVGVWELTALWHQHSLPSVWLPHTQISGFADSLSLLPSQLYSVIRSIVCQFLTNACIHIFIWCLWWFGKCILYLAVIISLSREDMWRARKRLARTKRHHCRAGRLVSESGSAGWDICGGQEVTPSIART